MKSLLDQFVCVRVVQANAMDLTLFQFDYDLTFAAFFLNADRTIYGRFGTRSSHDADKDVTIEGFRKTLQGALGLHQGYSSTPAAMQLLAGKQPKPLPTPVRTPEDYPSLRGKFKAELDYTGQTARSCMHCHQIRDAERLVYRAVAKPISDENLFPYPLPNVIGLILDPRTRATVASVSPDSIAERVGIHAGDEIVWMDGQPIISAADVQWVLHNVAEAATITMKVAHPGENMHHLKVELPRGWRRASDISWRTSTWDLRRMGTGGLLLESLPDSDRNKTGLAASDLALRVKHVGEYGEHAVAKNAGFRKGDIIVEFDGRSDPMTESSLLAHALQKKMPGDRVPVTVLRDGERVELKLPMQ